MINADNNSQKANKVRERGRGREKNMQNKKLTKLKLQKQFEWIPSESEPSFFFLFGPFMHDCAQCYITTHVMGRLIGLVLGDTSHSSSVVFFAKIKCTHALFFFGSLNEEKKRENAGREKHTIKKSDR